MVGGAAAVGGRNSIGITKYNRFIMFGGKCIANFKNTVSSQRKFASEVNRKCWSADHVTYVISEVQGAGLNLL